MEYRPIIRLERIDSSTCDNYEYQYMSDELKTSSKCLFVFFQGIFKIYYWSESVSNLLNASKSSPSFLGRDSEYEDFGDGVLYHSNLFVSKTGCLYLIGGVRGGFRSEKDILSDPTAIVPTVRKFGINSGEVCLDNFWVKHPMNFRNYGTLSMECGGKIFVLGMNEDRSSMTFESYDPTMDIWYIRAKPPFFVQIHRLSYIVMEEGKKICLSRSMNPGMPINDKGAFEGAFEYHVDANKWEPCYLFNSVKVDPTHSSLNWYKWQPCPLIKETKARDVPPISSSSRTYLGPSSSRTYPGPSSSRTYLGGAKFHFFGKGIMFRNWLLVRKHHYVVGYEIKNGNVVTVQKVCGLCERCGLTPGDAGNYSTDPTLLHFSLADLSDGYFCAIYTMSLEDTMDIKSFNIVTFKLYEHENSLFSETCSRHEIRANFLNEIEISACAA